MIYEFVHINNPNDFFNFLTNLRFTFIEYWLLESLQKDVSFALHMIL